MIIKVKKKIKNEAFGFFGSSSASEKALNNAAKEVMARLSNILSLDKEKNISNNTALIRVINAGFHKLKEQKYFNDKTFNITREFIDKLYKSSNNKVTTMITTWLYFYISKYELSIRKSAEEKQEDMFSGIKKVLDYTKDESSITKLLKSTFSINQKNFDSLKEDINSFLMTFNDKKEPNKEPKKNYLKTLNPPTEKEPQGSYDVDLDEQIKKHFKKFI